MYYVVGFLFQYIKNIMAFPSSLFLGVSLYL